MLTFILEAAARSLLMAVTVWACIRVLRVKAVLAQKVAWVLVLLAAVVMPLVMRAPFLALNRALEIPLRSLPGWFAAKSEAGLVAKQVLPAQAADAVKSAIPQIAKPSAAHRDTGSDESNDPVFNIDLKSDLSAQTAPPAVRPQTKVASTVILAEKKPAFWTRQRIKALSFFAYFGIGGILLLRTLAGAGLAYRVRQRATPASGTIADLAPRQGKPLDVRVSLDLNTPVTIGSTVLLPADYAEWDVDKQRAVLAHEQSHVRQGDFYLQLAAAIHAAVFWFSPLGWWLQRKLSELGEALSDRAGMEQAASPASYAEILLEFAAIPRKTSFFSPVAGVAMARTSNPSNLSSRIDRILNARRFRLEFLGGRRHAVLSAVLVPVALVAAVGLVRIAPSVHAAQVGKVVASPDPITAVNIAQAAPPVASAAPAPAPQAPDAEQPQAPEPPAEAEAPEAPEPPPATASGHGFAYAYSNDDDDDSFAVVQGNGNSVSMSGHGGSAFRKAREKYHNNFIWFERDGKSYVITDPAVLAKGQQLFKGNPDLELQQAKLAKMQAELQLKMEKLDPEKIEINLNSPEFKEQMVKLEAELAQLQSIKIKELTEKVTEEKLAEIQERIGNLQGHLGEIQGRIGEKQGELGEKQGKLGEQMGKLGEEMGKIGEEQGRQAEEASKKMRSVIDQAFKDGKAKPVE
jgi:beta-lactamase regulating signal transducer with metallopeptidase domain